MSIQLSIRNRLLLSGVLAIVFLALLAGVSVWGQQRNAAALDEVRHEGVEPMLAVQELDGILKEVRYRMLAMPLDVVSANGARQHLAESRERIPAVWGEFARGFRAAAAPAEERELVDAIGKEIENLKPLFEALDAAYARDDKAAAEQAMREQWPQVQKKLIKPLAQLVPSRVEHMQASLSGNQLSGRRLTTFAVTAGLLCIIALMLLNVPLIRSLSRAIGDLRGTLARVAQGDLTARADTRRGDELGDMARSVEATIESLHQIIGGVQHTAAALGDASRRLSGELAEVVERGKARSEYMDRAAASIESTSTSARDVADGSGKVAEASTEARSIAADGNGRMESAIGAIRRVEGAVEGSAAVMAELSDATARIQQITQVIREIADQTNLLALNAAIEAARAGEQGRGFAVVADEVRKLAERTAASTADITATVSAIQDKAASAAQAMKTVSEEVASGVRYSHETQQTLDDIVASAERVSELAQQIAGATRAQLAASENTVEEMGRISAMSTENSAAIGRVRAATDEVANSAGELQSLIGRFRV